MNPNNFEKYEKYAEKTSDKFQKDLRSFIEYIAYKERVAYTEMLDGFIAQLEETKTRNRSPVVGFDYIISRVKSLKEKILEQ